MGWGGSRNGTGEHATHATAAESAPTAGEMSAESPPARTQRIVATWIIVAGILAALAGGGAVVWGASERFGQKAEAKEVKSLEGRLGAIEYELGKRGVQLDGIAAAQQATRAEIAELKNLIIWGSRTAPVK